MSTLKATNIKNDSSASNNIVLDSSGGVVVSGVTTVSNTIKVGSGTTITSGTINVGSGTTITSSSLTVNGNNFPSAGPLSNRNLIINGAMRVAQRATSATITTNTQIYSTADRWKIELSQSSPNYTYTQSGDAPVGFTSSFKITNNAPASQSSSGTVYNLIGQLFERNVVECIGYGSSGSKPITISFWIKSNVTGSDVVELVIRRNNSSNTRSIAGQIIINAANTWEYKTVTFPADDSIPMDVASNALGFAMYFSLHGLVGGSKLSQYNTWVTGNYLGGPTGDTNVFASTTGAYMNVTGVQLELGEVATPFEHLSFGDDLIKCQRYCQVISQDNNSPYDRYTAIATGYTPNTSNVYGTITLPVTMRTPPSFANLGSNSTPLMITDWSGTEVTGLTINEMYGWDNNRGRIRLDSTYTAQRVALIWFNGNLTGQKIAFTAEL